MWMIKASMRGVQGCHLCEEVGSRELRHDMCCTVNCDICLVKYRGNFQRILCLLLSKTTTSIKHSQDYFIGFLYFLIFSLDFSEFQTVSFYYTPHAPLRPWLREISTHRSVKELTSKSHHVSTYILLLDLS